LKCRSYIIRPSCRIVKGYGAVGHMAHMGEERKLYKVLVGKREERDHSDEQGEDGIRIDVTEIIGWVRGHEVDSVVSG
jgi:hypothetical protein